MTMKRKRAISKRMKAIKMKRESESIATISADVRSEFGDNDCLLTEIDVYHRQSLDPTIRLTPSRRADPRR